MKIKKILCVAASLVTVAALSATNVFAGTSSFIMTLINESTHSYNASVLQDTYASKKKMSYRYTNQGAYLTSLFKNAAELESENNTAAITQMSNNPNYYYYLNTDYSTSSKIRTDQLSKFYVPSSSNFNNGGLDFFLATEGYATSSGKLISSDIAKGSTISAVGSNNKSALSTATNFDLMPLEWPSSSIFAGDVSAEESDYAGEVASTLSSSLNQIISKISDGQKITETTDLINKAILIRPDDESEKSIIKYGETYGYYLYYATATQTKTQESMNSIKETLSGLKDGSAYDTAAEFFNSTGLPAFDMNGNLLVYVVKYTMKDGYASLQYSGASSYVYAMPKGYKNGRLFTDSNGMPYAWAEDDNTWVSIHMLSQYANYAYKTEALTTGTYETAISSTNWVEDMIFDIVSNAVKKLYSFLGLSTTNELVYNGGARGSSSWNYGTMSDSWWNTVLRYHVIFQALAWVILIVGFFKSLISLNYSTINPITREHAYESIKRFIIVGFLLALVVPAVQFAMSLNSSIVGIFASQVQTELVAPKGISGFTGIIVFVFYMIITIYMNFLYVMRSITIGLLVVSSPIFIASIALTKRSTNNYVMGWAKELLSNIFIQSVHAFTLAFLTSLMQSGTSIETLIISFSIIPITEMFRNLVLAGGAGNTESLAKAAAAKATAFASSGITALAGSMSGTAGRIISGKTTSVMGDEANRKAMAGGKGGKGINPGALTTAVNSKLSDVVDKRAETKAAIANGNKGKFALAMNRTGSTLTRLGMAAGRTSANFGKTFSSLSMGEFTGNAGQYANAGDTVGNAIGGTTNQAVGHIGEIINRGKKYNEDNYQNKVADISGSESIGQRAVDKDGLKFNQKKTGSFRLDGGDVAKMARSFEAKAQVPNANFSPAEKDRACMAIASKYTTDTTAIQNFSRQMGWSGDAKFNAKAYLNTRGINHINNNKGSVTFDKASPRQSTIPSNSKVLGSDGRTIYRVDSDKVNVQGTKIMQSFTTQPTVSSFLNNCNTEERDRLNTSAPGSVVKLDCGAACQKNSDGSLNVTWSRTGDYDIQAGRGDNAACVYISKKDR